MDFQFLKTISDDELYELFEKTIGEMNHRKTQKILQEQIKDTTQGNRHGKI